MSAIERVHEKVTAIAETWEAERAERQQRRYLDPADFDALQATGLFLLPVPVDQGGHWAGIESAAGLCAVYRTLAGADPSVALVSSMHPAVLGYWLSTSDSTQPAWEEQRQAVFQSAADGRQWGTITSEPGSGGDILRTRTVAVPDPDGRPDLPGTTYRLTGDKHFGSGFGQCDLMFTTAVVDGEDGPSAFFLDTRRALAEAPDSLRVTHEWDGVGMKATQSHAARLEGVEAVRLAWDGPIDPLVANTGGFITTLFTAVILGVFDEAIAVARPQVAARADGLRAFEQVEWTRAELEHWTAVQAYEGAVRAVAAGDPVAGLRAGLRAKTAVAELAETSIRRLSAVLGGGTFSGRSPFAHWGEDVRALGFLRPPWGLAFDSLFLTSLG